MVDQNKLRIGIVSWGSISDIHAQAIVAAENCLLQSVYTSDPKKTNEITSKYDVNVFNDYIKFLHNSEINAVSICTPSGAHKEFALQAAEAGKHVIIEKPIEVNVERAKDIIEACRKANVKLSVIFQNRYLPAVKHIKNTIESGALGDIFHASAYIKWYRDQDYYDSGAWRGTKLLDGGGALMNQGIHTVDLLQYLVGRVSSVYGTIGTFTHKRIEVEDSACAIVNFNSGAIGSIEGSTSINPAQERRIEIHGKNGTAVLDGDKAIIDIGGKRISADVPDEDGAGADSPFSGFTIDPHKHQFEEISDSISKNNNPFVDGEEALQSLAIVAAIYESHEKKEPVLIKKMLGI